MNTALPFFIIGQIKDILIYLFYSVYLDYIFRFQLVNCCERELGKVLSELLPSEYHHVTGNYEKEKKKF